MKRSEIEIPFIWTCPKCFAVENDTFNPKLGPFCNVICGECGSVSDNDQLSPEGQASWDAAIKTTGNYIHNFP